MKKKLIGFGIALAIVVVCYAIDFLVSMGYNFEIVSMEPYPGVADGNTHMSIEVRLTRADGSPVEGHDISILSLNGGTYTAYRLLSDANGTVVFDYIPFLATSVRPAQDVPMRVRDESSSIFIAVPPNHTFVVEVNDKEEGSDTGLTSSSFFG